MWGILYGLGRGVENHVFFANSPLQLTVWVFLACCGQVSDRLHCTMGMWSMIVFEPLVLISKARKRHR